LSPTPTRRPRAPRLAYNAQNSVLHAYEHALSELLTKLDAAESFEFKAVRDARKELVDRIERELEELEKRVTTALEVNEDEEKVQERGEEKTKEGKVEKEAVEDVHMEDRPAVAPAEVSEASKAPTLQGEHMGNHKFSRGQAESVLSAPANSNVPARQTVD